MEPREAREIVALLHKVLGEGEPLARGFRAVGEINDAFVAGNQYGGVTYKNSQTIITKDDWFDDEDVPRIHINILGNLVATLVSLITKNRPCAVARALNEDDAENVYRAESSNTIIRFLSQELKAVEVIQRAVKLAETHGSGGVKIWFNPTEKKACIAPVSIFNVTMDPQAEDADDALTFVFHRWLRKQEAAEHIASVGVKKGAREEEYTTASGIKKKGVPAHELWIRPGYDDNYPRGCYAFIVDDVVVEKTDYPLLVEDDAGPQSLAPLVWIVAKPVEECVYGRTAVTDCVPIQRTLNETISRMIKYLRIGSSPKLVHPDNFPEGFDPYTDAKLPFPLTDMGIAAAKAIVWLHGPPIPEEAFDLRDFMIKEMHDVLGVAPITAGTQTRNVSGKALEEIEGLDEQKNSQTTRSIETATLELYRILLAIVHTRYDNGRKLQIMGGSRAEVMLFNRADIMGRNIRLEPASEVDLMQPNEEQLALERQQEGLGTAADVHAAARDPRTAYTRQIAEKLIAQMLAGKNIEIGADDVDPDAFKAVIAKHKHLAMLDGRKSDYLALTDLEKFIDGLALDAHDNAAPLPPAPDQQQPPSASPAPAPAPQGPIQ